MSVIYSILLGLAIGQVGFQYYRAELVKKELSKVLKLKEELESKIEELTKTVEKHEESIENITTDLSTIIKDIENLHQTLANIYQVIGMTTDSDYVDGMLYETYKDFLDNPMFYNDKNAQLKETLQKYQSNLQLRNQNHIPTTQPNLN